MRSLLLSIAVALSMTASLQAQTIDTDKVVSRIALGSCIRQDRPQPIWEAVLEYQPQIFLLIGDNIYGDSEDVEILRAKYGQLAANPGFKKLRAACPILATWDDHDYGVNDGGVEYPTKQASQQLFNDFFGTPADSPRRSRAGIYDSVILGPAGQRVQIILLDTRFFRSPLNTVRKTGTGLGPYGPGDDPQSTMLGTEQWKWLEKELKQPAELRIIASSVQFVPYEHGWEMWGNFPHERQRMLELIQSTGAKGVLFISGDRHLAEISRIDPDNVDHPENKHVPYPIFDLTSSSINQPSGGGNEGEPNRYRVGDHYPKVNFGTIDIEWAPQPVVTLGIRDLDGEVVLQQRLPLADLQPATSSDR